MLTIAVHCATLCAQVDTLCFASGKILKSVGAPIVDKHITATLCLEFLWQGGG
jgi:hypothetical protein